MSPGLRRCCHSGGSCVTSPPWLPSAMGRPTPGKTETLPPTFSPKVSPCSRSLSLGNPVLPAEPPSSGPGPCLDSRTQGTMDGLQEDALNSCARAGVSVSTVILWGQDPQLAPHFQRAPESGRFRSAPLPKRPECCPLPEVPMS